MKATKSTDSVFQNTACIESEFDRIDETSQALIDQLISATKLYSSSCARKALLEFTIRFRAFAPFNAMLLHIQKPGLTYAATAEDWKSRFNRVPKSNARPLLILRTMGPVDFVWDIQDTKGDAVPCDAFAFPAFGNMTEIQFSAFLSRLRSQQIEIEVLNAGDAQAGRINLVSESDQPNGKNLYRLAYNCNHAVQTRFVTVAHELAHLYLGHMGPDRGRRVSDRKQVNRALREVEAETVAYIVAMRNGIEPRSESYLYNHIEALPELDFYAVTRAANAVETVLGISAAQLRKEKYHKSNRRVPSGRTDCQFWEKLL